MQKSIWSVFALFVLGVFGCNHPTTEVNNRFNDIKLQKIYELQDRRETKRLIPFLKAKKAEHRIAAVLAFASIQDPDALEFVRVNLLTDTNPEVRKAAAYVIGQLRDSSNVGLLFMALENEIIPDSRKYILEALGKSADSNVMRYFNTFETAATQLRQGHVIGMYRSLFAGKIGKDYALRSIQYFEPQSSEETKFYAASILSRLPDQYTEAHLEALKKLYKRNSKGEIGRLLKKFSGEQTLIDTLPDVRWKDIEEATKKVEVSQYKIAELLSRFKIESEMDQGAVAELALDYRYQIVRTFASNAYFSSLQNDTAARQREEYITFVKSSITSRDMALQSNACIDIAKYPNETFLPLLKTFQDSLAMPRQLETFIDFEKAICKLESREYVKPVVPYNHPIDWKYVEKIPEDQHVKISTTKGDIIIQLAVNDAPGSVANFVKQVKSHYYDKKFFHRVVPNFVIQAGCVRGDGWGSLDWTQRSEFSNYLRYKTGAVGLASVGNDTEGVQFFITHNPTPFLDGRYTIFAQVVEGMNVVHTIEIGDRIQTITLIDSVQK